MKKLNEKKIEIKLKYNLILYNYNFIRKNEYNKGGLV